MKSKFACTGIVFALMIVTVSVSCTGSSARGLGARPGTPAEVARMAALYTPRTEVAPNAYARARAAQEAQATASGTTATRPSAVDNSTLAWFPPIGNQGDQSSCVAWAVGYYYDTYVQAKDEGLTVSGGDTSEICSPSFLYPLLNDGADNGLYLDATLAELAVTGCSSLALTPYSQTDYTTWPAEAAWVEALRRRVTDPQSISPTTSSGLEAVKQLLANGQLAVFQLDVYDNLYSSYPSGDGISSDVLYGTSGPYVGGHAMTLVGYDDTKAYTDREGTAHTGAFLAANSWGSSWGVSSTTSTGKGFIWIAYDAFSAGRFIHSVLYADDLPDYRPSVYALVGVASSQRGTLTLSGGNGLPSSPKATTIPVLEDSGGTALAVSSAKRIAVDLTDLDQTFPLDQLSDLFVTLTVGSTASSSGTLASAEFFGDLAGTGAYTSLSVASLPTTVSVGSTEYGFLPLFSDVDWDSAAYAQVEACYVAGVVTGYDDGSYRPTVAVARDQMAVYISRALASGDAAVPTAPTAATFSDVPTDYWAFRYIEYAVRQGIVMGYEDGTYGPIATVDRGTMAVYVARAMAGGDMMVPALSSTADIFPDVTSSYWSAKYISYIKTAGVTGGYPDGNYHPEYTVTRDLMAVYVARAFGLEPTGV
jgi:C1A family cysteine protease